MAGDSKGIQSAVTLEPWYLTVPKRVYLAARRILTIISPLIGVYVIVGSYMFGEWWYGFFWDRGFERGTYLAEGVDYLLASRIVLSIGIVVVLFITIVCVVSLKRKVFPFVDRFAWLVLRICSYSRCDRWPS